MPPAPGDTVTVTYQVRGLSRDARRQPTDEYVSKTTTGRVFSVDGEKAVVEMLGQCMEVALDDIVEVVKSRTTPATDRMSEVQAMRAVRQTPTPAWAEEMRQQILTEAKAIEEAQNEEDDE